MTFDELLRYHTCREAVQETIQAAARLGIRSWEFVKIPRDSLHPTWDDAACDGEFYAWTEANAKIKGWLYENMDTADWAVIREPYFVAFRSVQQAMLFSLTWGSVTRRHR